LLDNVYTPHYIIFIAKHVADRFLGSLSKAAWQIELGLPMKSDYRDQQSGFVLFACQ
jgi:hypothetical protein